MPELQKAVVDYQIDMERNPYPHRNEPNPEKQ